MTRSPYVSPAEKAALDGGFTGLAAAIRAICARKVPSDFGKVPNLDQLQKAELYLAHYGWRHACDGTPMLPVADMARVFDVIVGKQMTWREAIDFLQMEKALKSVPDLTVDEAVAIVEEERRRIQDFQWSAQQASRAGQFDAEEQAAVDRFLD